MAESHYVHAGGTMLKILFVSAAFCAVWTQAFGQASGAISDAKIQCAKLAEPFRGGILTGKVDLDGQLPSTEMMALDSVPTPEELQVLAKFARVQEQCNQIGENVAAQYAPWAYAAQSRLSQQFSTAYADLLTGKFSYGFTNRRLASAQRDFDREFIAARAAATPSAPYYPQMSPLGTFGSALIGAGNAIQSATPPLPTLAPPVNCASYQLGNTIQTRCQ